MIQKHFRLLSLSVLLLLSPLGWGQATQYGPIKSGDLIWDIALKVRVDESLSRFQMMQALLAKNPQAFSVSCNVNSPLKVGEMLNIPSLAEVQQFSKGEARRQFAAQSDTWQQARKARQDIECPEVDTSISEPVVNTQAPLIPTPTIAPIPPQQPTITAELQNSTTPEPSVTNMDNKAYPQPLSPFIVPPTAGTETARNTTPQPRAQIQPNDALNMEPPATTLPPSPATPDPHMPNVPLPMSELADPSALAELQRTFSALPWWLLMTFGVVLALIFMLLIGLLFALRRAKTATNAMHALSPVAPPSQSQPKMSTAVWGDLPTKKNTDNGRAQSNNANMPAYEIIEQQLANIRTCLAAEGETQAVRILLREVMERGTQHQQSQAQQLLEIGRKMHWLEERQGRSGEKPSAANAETASERSAESSNSDSYLPQQYLPEEQERVFELVDKIFKMLDQELQADGQLVKAYMNRHQREQFWDSRNYKIIDKVQTPFPETAPPAEDVAQGREAKPAPRYL